MNSFEIFLFQVIPGYSHFHHCNGVNGFALGLYSHNRAMDISVFRREALKMNKRTYSERIKTITTVPQPQPGRPNAGANTEGYAMEGWEGVVMRKPRAPPDFTLSCLCLPPPHLLPPKPYQPSGMQSALYLRKGRCPRPVSPGTTRVARCRAGTGTVAPQSGQDWRWRGSSEHTRGGEPELLKKRRTRREEEGGKKIRP